MSVCFLNKDAFLKDSEQSVKMLLCKDKVLGEVILAAVEDEGLIPEGYEFKRTSTWWVKEHSRMPGHFEETYQGDQEGFWITVARFDKATKTKEVQGGKN